MKVSASANYKFSLEIGCKYFATLLKVFSIFESWKRTWFSLTSWINKVELESQEFYELTLFPDILMNNPFSKLNKQSLPVVGP